MQKDPVPEGFLLPFEFKDLLGKYPAVTRYWHDIFGVLVE